MTFEKCLLIFSFIGVTVFSAHGQTSSEKRSIENDLKTVDELFYSNPDSALNLAIVTLTKVEKSGNQKQIAEISITIGILYVEKNLFSEAAKHYRKALISAEKINDTILLARAYGNFGNYYLYIGDYEMAIENFSKASELFEAKNENSGIAVACGAIGNLYFLQEDYQKAEWYFNKALEKYSQLNDTAGIATTYLDLGVLFKLKLDYQKALDYFEKAAKIFVDLGYIRYVGQSYANIGNVFTEQKKYDQAFTELSLALEYFIQAESPEDIARCNLDLAELFLSQNNTAKANDYIQVAEEIALQYNFTSLLIKTFEKHYILAKIIGDQSLALEYHEKWSYLSDSVSNAEKDMRVSELSARYDLERKENDILILNKENRIKELSLEKKNNLILLLSGVFILISLFLFLLILFIKQKAKTKQVLLKQELQSNTLKAVIEAEDKEKARFASDLHDGLGPLLSTAKLYVEQISRTVDIDPEIKEMSVSAIEIMNDSIDSARQISHNLSPLVLKQTGLKNALLKMAQTINNSGQIQLFTYLDEIKSDELTERYIYRIIQELTNNTLKYASATEIKIILKSGNNINLHYSDNGKGFDYIGFDKSAKESSGIANIRTRVNQLGGHFEIISSLGNGFIANISIHV